MKLALVPAPRITLDAATHLYEVDGRPVEGWSEKVRKAPPEFGLVPDYSRVPEHVLANAAGRGAQIDDACAKLMAGTWTFTDWLKLYSDAQPYVKAYAALWKRLKPGITGLRVQTPLYCRELDFCTTPDWHDHVSVNDLKATATHSRTWGLQIAAQQHAHGHTLDARIYHLRPHLKTRQIDVYARSVGDRRVFSKWDHDVVEAVCREEWDAEAIDRWRKGE
jgi:hypothetical protein